MYKKCLKYVQKLKESYLKGKIKLFKLKYEYNT